MMSIIIISIISISMTTISIKSLLNYYIIECSQYLHK